MKLLPGCARFLGLFAVVACASVAANISTFGYVRWGQVALVLLVFVACYFVIGVLFRVASGNPRDDEA